MTRTPLSSTRQPGEGPVDHATHLGSPDRGQQAVRAIEACRHRFFHEKMQALFRGRDAEFHPGEIVAVEVDRIQFLGVQEGGVISVSGASVVLHGPLDEGFVWIGHRDEVGATKLPEFIEIGPDVIVRQTEHANAKSGVVSHAEEKMNSRGGPTRSHDEPEAVAWALSSTWSHFWIKGPYPRECSGLETKRSTRLVD